MVAAPHGNVHHRADDPREHMAPAEEQVTGHLHSVEGVAGGTNRKLRRSARPAPHPAYGVRGSIALPIATSTPTSTSRPTRGSRTLPASKRLHPIMVSGQTRRICGSSAIYSSHTNAGTKKTTPGPLLSTDRSPVSSALLTAPAARMNMLNRKAPRRSPRPRRRLRSASSTAVTMASGATAVRM